MITAMKTDIMLSVFLLISVTACSQTASESSTTNKDREVGGRCEGCEAALEFGSRKLSWTDTLPDYHDDGPKLEVSGIIYKTDGRTPAKDVILYVYHTDRSGIYPKRGDGQGWAQRHGYIRGG
jgi:protocatechuate 3,4-dioxygenase, beta subunit